jgi:hypothetical protein
MLEAVEVARSKVELLVAVEPAVVVTQVLGVGTT